MDFYEQEKIQEMKRKKLYEQGGKCAACGKYFKYGEAQELAHILPRRKWIIEKFSAEVIHHELNMKLTHSGDCNSKVQISPNWTEIVLQHVKIIQEAIGNEYN